jgi:predicted metal-dependent enzyme (double-stranded beta helix superfamily)
MAHPHCWLLDNQSAVSAWTGSPALTPARPYRLYRFLSDLEDLLETRGSDQDLLRAALPLLQRLIASSPWLGWAAPPPDPESGWSVQILYDEPDFPLTVQLVSWAPGSISPIHNHGCWGLVTLLAGCERNDLWSCSPTAEGTVEMVRTGALQLQPGDTLLLLPDAIHSVEALGEVPTVSFNCYGPTDYSQRFEFDPLLGTAQLF